MYADLDYDEMQQAMDVAARTPRRDRAADFRDSRAGDDGQYPRRLRVAAASGAAILKLLLVTHLSNRTGIVMPVKEIVAMARARGRRHDRRRRPDHRPSRFHAGRSRCRLRRLLAAQVAVRADRHRCDLDSRQPAAGHRAVHGQHDVPGRRYPQPHQRRHRQLRRRDDRARGDRLPPADRRPAQAGSTCRRCAATGSSGSATSRGSRS